MVGIENMKTILFHDHMLESIREKVQSYLSQIEICIYFKLMENLAW